MQIRTNDGSKLTLITLAAACRELGVTTWTGTKLSQQGQLPPIVKVGRRSMVSKRQFELFRATLARQLGEDDA